MPFFQHLRPLFFVNYQLPFVSETLVKAHDRVT